VVVVQQPFAGRTDVAAPVRGGGEPGVDVLEDPPGAVEPGEERRAPAASPDPEALAGWQLLRPLRQVLSAEELAPDRTSEEILAGGRAALEEAVEEAAGMSQRYREDLGEGCRASAGWKIPPS